VINRDLGMIPSPHELIYFIELANTLNFSRASERIGISQPSLSSAIKRLERTIGTELFIRGKNGVVLTQAGKRLLSHSKQLLQLWDTVKSESLASHHEVQGSILLGCHPSVALYSLHRFLPTLFSKYPKLEIQLKHDLSRKIVEGIINLSIDIGIIVNPVKHDDLIIKKLYDDKVTLWHTTDANNTNQNIHSGDVVIICDPELTQTQWLLKRLHKVGVHYRRLIASNNLEVIANLTAHGAGIGILPTSVARSNYLSKLKPLPKMPSYHDEICLAYRHENRDIKAVQVIVNAIKKSIT
jgi:LysR family transcriptional regulator, cell division regulator